jgi:hypothetical protein
VASGLHGGIRTRIFACLVNYYYKSINHKIIQHGKERKKLVHTERIQVLFKIITIDFCSAEDNSLVHFMFSYGPDAIFSF